MKFLTAIVICFAFLTAGMANAERVFDLEIEVKFNSSGVRETADITGVLTLFDDRTYLLEQSGEEFGGVWLQERNKLQLFEEGDFTVGELFTWIEQDASDFVGFPVMLTSMKFKETARLNRAGDLLKVRSKQTNLFRPGLRGTSPLKIIWSYKIVGTLR
jgi:hypothetical protein